MKESQFFFLVIIFVLVACVDQNHQHPEGWKLVYRNGRMGETLYGNKHELLSAVRSGLPVRIGWGGKSRIDSTRSMEHVAEAQFLSIIDNSEVFAQISPITGQLPVRGQDSLFIKFREQNTWTKIAGTNGYATGLMYNYVQDTLVSYGRDNKNRTSWYVRYEGNLVKDASPLWE